VQELHKEKQNIAVKANEDLSRLMIENKNLKQQLSVCSHSKDS
jgi:hypothetical protein